MDLRGLDLSSFLLSSDSSARSPHVENEQRHDLSCPQVDDERLILREDHVHTDQCSHWPDFEDTSLHGAQIGQPADGDLAFLLDLISSCACPRFSS